MCPQPAPSISYKFSSLSLDQDHFFEGLVLQITDVLPPVSKALGQTLVLRETADGVRVKTCSGSGPEQVFLPRIKS